MRIRNEIDILFLYVFIECNDWPIIKRYVCMCIYIYIHCIYIYNYIYTVYIYIYCIYIYIYTVYIYIHTVYIYIYTYIHIKIANTPFLLARSVPFKPWLSIVSIHFGVLDGSGGQTGCWEWLLPIPSRRGRGPGVRGIRWRVIRMTRKASGLVRECQG